MTKILVVEDEQAIRSFVIINLKSAGFKVLEAESGEKALSILEEDGQDIDIALLDVMLPGIDGFEVCEHIRKKYSHIGIIMLTAKVQEDDRVHGLTIGADDYVAKPFSPPELVARVKALLRRTKRKKKQVEKITSGPFEFYIKEERLTKHNVTIDLTPTEFQLAKHLLKHKNQPLSRNELLDLVWGENYIGDTKIVDVNIRRLRRKIEDDPSSPKYVETYWGRGYIWRDADR
ncbi:response regulator transcription factor [Fictibacillus sp. Mic-4]|uniref:response regulator transcription factor n=1 Tax=Fictibacillus TaxID=1329200 RepID=UPI00040CE2C7|nr:response regulator transcription factor [Fictibacillus gelatini]